MVATFQNSLLHRSGGYETLCRCLHTGRGYHQTCRRSGRVMVGVQSSLQKPYLSCIWTPELSSSVLHHLFSSQGTQDVRATPSHMKGKMQGLSVTGPDTGRQRLLVSLLSLCSLSSVLVREESGVGSASAASSSAPTAETADSL